MSKKIGRPALLRCLAVACLLCASCEEKEGVDPSAYGYVVRSIGFVQEASFGGDVIVGPWSEDGQRLVLYGQQGALVVSTSALGRPIKYAHCHPREAVWGRHALWAITGRVGGTGGVRLLRLGPESGVIDTVATGVGDVHLICGHTGAVLLWDVALDRVRVLEEGAGADTVLYVPKGQSIVSGLVVVLRSGPTEVRHVALKGLPEGGVEDVGGCRIRGAMLLNVWTGDGSCATFLVGSNGKVVEKSAQFEGVGFIATSISMNERLVAGTWCVASASSGEDARIRAYGAFLRTSSSGELCRIIGGEHAVSPLLSPDGSWLAFNDSRSGNVVVGRLAVSGK